jgi:hypothetical protein
MQQSVNLDQGMLQERIVITQQQHKLAASMPDGELPMIHHRQPPVGANVPQSRVIELIHNCSSVRRTAIVTHYNLKTFVSLAKAGSNRR